MGGVACPVVDLASFETTCVTDSDCMPILTGNWCQYGCPSCQPANAAINTSGAALYESETTLPYENSCGCIADNAAACVAGQCVLCPGGACGDGGQPEGGYPGVIVGLSDDAGKACVQVDLASYGRACSEAGECVPVQQGEVCNDQCYCEPDAAINTAEEPTYFRSLGVVNLATCDCPYPPPSPACVGGKCVPCTGRDQPPECRAK